MSNTNFEPVRLGVIGCGVIGSVHIRVAAHTPFIDLVAIADLREDVLKERAAEYHVPTVYTDGDELLADPNIEGVVLAMPAHIRTDLALRAFAAGKHVLTEKPVAMNADEVQRLIDARGDLVVGCCSSRYQFIESTKAVTDFIAAGALGNIQVIRCHVNNPAGGPPQKPPPIWRLNRSLNAGGIMSNWGCYDLDYLLGITGWSLKPKLVLGQTWTVNDIFSDRAAPRSDAETYVTALIRCEGGTVISFERGEFMAAHPHQAWQIIGDKGSLRLQLTPKEGKEIILDKGDYEQGVISEVIWSGKESNANVHSGPIQDFARAIREERAPQTSLERALVVQQITDAIYESADNDVAVSI